MEDMNKVIGILEEKFLKVPTEITLISEGISMREFLYLSDIKIKDKLLYLNTGRSSYTSINMQKVDVWHYYGPGSLVFVMSNGATFTLRPQI